MASLNNLYISQSYQGLVHFGSNTTASAALGIIEDGLGNSLGLYLNNSGDLRTNTSVSSSLIQATNLIIKNKIELTGSIDIDGPVTASNAFIEGDLIVSGTLSAYKIHTTIESASVIFSSGSNILGDSTADTQTLNGKVIVSGSEEITGSLFVTNNISSSTISGIGNVTLFSQSVDARLDFLEGPFSTSVDSRLDNLENFTSSTYVTFSQSVDLRLDNVEATASYLNGPFSTSVDARLDALEAFTGSQGLVTTSSFQAYTASIRTELNTIEVATASLNSFTQSANSRLNSLEAATASYANSASVASTITNLSSSIAITDDAQTVRINGLASFTGSYATTGSNTFIGNQTITGSLILSSSAAIELTTIGNSIFSGSVRGQVLPIATLSNTASIDCSTSNFFTLTLISGSATRLVATNIQPGETIGLRITQPQVGFGTLTYDGSIRFPQAFPYIPTPSGSAIDILTFQSYDTSVLYGVAVNTMR